MRKSIIISLIVHVIVIGSAAAWTSGFRHWHRKIDVYQVELVSMPPLPQKITMEKTAPEPVPVEKKTGEIVYAGGRIVGLFLMVVGIGLFGIFTSSLGDWFRQPRRRREEEKQKLNNEHMISEARIRELLEQQQLAYQKSIDDLAKKLDDLGKQ